MHLNETVTNCVNHQFTSTFYDTIKLIGSLRVRLSDRPEKKPMPSAANTLTTGDSRFSDRNMEIRSKFEKNKSNECQNGSSVLQRPTEQLNEQNQPRTTMEENPPKRQKKEEDFRQNQSTFLFFETRILIVGRSRTFSHWTKFSTIPAERFITAGFYCCNVSDRTICLYCNLICQQWNDQTDDPLEVHRILSPACIYVVSKLKMISNGTVVGGSNGNNDHGQGILQAIPSHPSYINSEHRMASFDNVETMSTGKVAAFVESGFFYDPLEDVVKCFQCDGSIKNYQSMEDPKRTHMETFPQCSFSQRQRQDSNINRGGNGLTYGRNTEPRRNPALQLQINDESLLSRLVAARLDLPSSQRLLNQNFKLSVIKRAWEDQLRLKRDDFVSDSDLYIACVILQRQIDVINGDREKIIVPQIKMKALRDGTANQAAQLANLAKAAAPESKTKESVSKEKPIPVEVPQPMEVQGEVKRDVNIEHPCLVCSTQEKQLACIPCGHLVACSGCSNKIRVCPTCRREIEAYVRVYL